MNCIFRHYIICLLKAILSVILLIFTQRYQPKINLFTYIFIFRPHIHAPVFIYSMFHIVIQCVPRKWFG